MARQAVVGRGQRRVTMVLLLVVVVALMVVRALERPSSASSTRGGKEGAVTAAPAVPPSVFALGPSRGEAPGAENGAADV